MWTRKKYGRNLTVGIIGRTISLNIFLKKPRIFLKKYIYIESSYNKTEHRMNIRYRMQLVEFRKQKIFNNYVST